MQITWQEAFSKGEFPWHDESTFSDTFDLTTLPQLKRFLDAVHIKYCLIQPYQLTKAYPVVEAKELLPSFEADLFEFENLHGFSLVAFDRQLSSFNEIFQYDTLHSTIPLNNTDKEQQKKITACIEQNLNTLLTRLPRYLHDELEQKFGSVNISILLHYPALFNYLLRLDRAQVLARDTTGQFSLAGIFASFPSDINTEIKHFGLRIGRFSVGNNKQYETNRLFVYQFLMELYGFPIVSERRTSSALFARRLHKMGEKFIIRVLGQSDRTITTLYNYGESRHYPRIEKIALVRIDVDQTELLKRVEAGGFFLDAAQRIVVLRVTYKQHRYSDQNVQKDRALSVDQQEIIHPLTGQILSDLNIIKDSSSFFLQLNDIVQGEFIGKTLFKRTEIVENTDTDEKKLKFLHSWLSKHQRRIINYSEEFFHKIALVLESYLFTEYNQDIFSDCSELHSEVETKYRFIQQARKVRVLEDIFSRNYKSRRLGYAEQLDETVTLLHTLKFEIVSYFDSLVVTIIKIGEAILSNNYLIRNYIDKNETALTEKGMKIRKKYGMLVVLVDEFKAIRKARAK